MKRIQNWILAIMFTTTFGGALLATVPMVTAHAVDCSGNNAFLTLPAWYRGLATPNKTQDGCDITSPTGDQNGLSNFIWHIVLNGIDIALQLVGYISTFFVLYGGFLYLTSSGEAAGVAKAKTTLTNAIIGLVISIASVAIVNLIFGIITGPGSV